jgi:hypothetical protein
MGAAMTADFRFTIALLIALATGQTTVHFIKLGTNLTAASIALAGGSAAFLLIRETTND